MSQFKLFSLMLALTLLFVGLGTYVGGSGGALFFLIVAGVMNFGAYFASDRIALGMARARPLEPGEIPWLRDTVEELAARAEIPVPRLHLIESESPNAFATGRNPEHSAVAVTTGLLTMLTREEVRGVVAHELAHIRHRDTLLSVIVATLAGAITWIASNLRWGLFWYGNFDDRQGGRNPFAILLVTIVVGAAATLLRLAISREREYYADAGGALISGDPLSLANALQRIEVATRVEPLPVNPALGSLFIVQPLFGGRQLEILSTHPPTHERVRRLEEIARSGSIPL